MKKKWIHVLAIIFLFLIFSCTTQKSKNVENSDFHILWIDSAYEDCMGVAPMKCLLIKFKPNDNWQLHYDGIEGFTYEEGYSYIIKVKKITKDKSEVPADASTVVYQLVELLEKRKEPSRFLDASWKLIKINAVLVAPIITLEFNQKAMFVSGFDGCNRFSGKIKQLTAEQFELGTLISTKMYCEHTTEIANQYISILSQPVNYVVNEKELIIIQNETKLEFQKSD